MMRVVVAIVVVGMWTACRAGLPAVPGQGGPAWIELTSEHFTLWTDADPARGRELVNEIEHLRQIVVAVAFPSAPLAGHSLVITLRDDSELSEFWVNGEARAWAGPAYAPLWQPYIVLSAFSATDRIERVVAHELTHLVSFAVLHRQPRWLAEGMAQYFETMQLDPGNDQVDIGVAPEFRGQPMRMSHLISAASLFAWHGQASSFEERGHYSSAWALFNFLVNRHRDELVRYLELIERIQPRAVDDRAAQLTAVWREAFPSLPLAELDGELRRWLVSGSHIVLHVRAQRRNWPAEQRPLSDADVYAIRAFLHGSPPEAAQSNAELAAALEAEPTQVLAQLLTLTRGGAHITPEQARATVAAHGDDWRAWWLASVAMSATHGARSEIDQAAAKACTLIAQNPALVAPPNLCRMSAAGPAQ